MNTIDWRRAEEAFQSILDLPVEQRAAALAQLPERIRPLVEKLLGADSSGNTIARTIEGAATLVPPPGPTAGAYRLVRQIGAGGMGAVYLAVRDDDTFEKKVAVKFVLRGLDSPMLRERFDAERRILARLEHSSIARLLDAGETAEGQPYLVLEYVEGKTIVDHARTAGLTVRQRVELFRKVCDAVQYAHQTLVVHRDIKPSNIMIDAAGTPKLLDFGIAKLIDPSGQGQAAATIFRLLTPDYASPEQIRGEPAGVASDVYSLGAVLYELLAGSPPFRLAGMTPADAERAITQTGPPKPSERNPELRRLLDGDLDNIVLKAMRKQERERYQSVVEFSADLERYLDGRPVVARDYRPWERAAKFVGRHRLGTVATATVAASLLTGAVLAERSAVRAEEARRIAVAERQRADEQRAEAARNAALATEHAREAAEQRGIAERRYDEEQTAIARILQDIYIMGPIQGSTAARRGVLEKAIPYLEKLAAEPRANEDVRLNLARAYEGLGYLIASDTSTAAVGNRQEGIALLQKSREMLEKLQQANPDRRDYLVGLAQTCGDLGEVFADISNDLKPSQRYFQEAIAMGRRAVAQNPGDAYALDTLMRSQITRMQSIVRRDPRQVDPKDIAEYNRLAQIAYKGNPEGLKALDALAYVKTTEGTLHYLRGEYQQAVKPFEEALTLRERAAALAPHDAGYQRMLLVSHSHVADTYGYIYGRGSERAGRHYLRMIEISERLATDPSDRTSQYNLASGLSRYAGHERDAGKPASGLPYAERSLAIFKTLVVAQEASLAIRQTQVNTLRIMAELQSALKSPDAARYWRDTLDTGEALIGRFPTDAYSLTHTSRAAMWLAQESAAAGRREEAVALARRALGYAERSAAVPGLSQVIQYRLTQARGEAALIFADADRTLRSEAVSLAVQSAEAIGGIPRDHLALEWPAEERAKVKALAGR